MGRTLTEEIYEALRNDIIFLRIKPGEKVSEAKLARQYHVSRAPIRNVIQKLNKEHLLLIKPQVGTIIMPISLKKAVDVLEVRLLLEPYAAEIAANKVTRKDLEILEAEFSRLEEKDQKEEGKKNKLFAADHLLHETIWRLCGNQEIYNIINNYLDDIKRIHLSNLEIANRLVPSEQEMKGIFRALKKRDPRRARDSMRKHILNIMQAIEQAIRKRRKGE